MTAFASRRLNPSTEAPATFCEVTKSPAWAIRRPAWAVLIMELIYRFLTRKVRSLIVSKTYF